LCDTHDTTILIVDTSGRYRRYLRDDTTAVYRSSKKYRETAQVSWISRYIQVVPLGNECTLQVCDTETNLIIVTVKQ